MGTGHFCTSDTFARASLLHEGTLLHEDTFARRVPFARGDTFGRILVTMDLCLKETLNLKN